jgi:glycosyltransferase involved in cell wall biosynthesis
MRVLIADFDLFRTVGGGQTFYRAIIEKNPKIDFFYLTVKEAADAPRPPNARAIAYQQEYLDRHWTHYCDILPPRWSLSAFLLACNIAWSVRGEQFDVIDLPDYQQFGYFLASALTHHEVGVGRIALSMHGVISTSVGMNWESDGKLLRALVLQEDMQYQCADLRYGLSTTYLDEWHARFSLPTHYLSPLRFTDLPVPTHSPRGEAPDLNFMGRTEKRKGPDLFAELVWWLPTELYGRTRIIGPSSHSQRGVASEDHLLAFLRNRPLPRPIELLPSATRAELAELFAGRSVTVVPSRYDTFNLLAIESLFSGCPTAIGSGAGVCRFLDELFPHVPYVKIDMESPLAAVWQLQAVLADYDRYRCRLVESLAAATPAVCGPSLAEIYAGPAAFNEDVRREADDWYQRLMRHRGQTQAAIQTAGELARRLVRKRTTPELRARLRKLHPRRIAAVCKQAAKRTLTELPPVRRRLDRRLAESRATAFATRYFGIAWMPEHSAADLDRKWQQCAQLIGDLRIDRIRLWRELARLEALRGNDLVGATYRLRAMRLAGEDRFRDLRGVVATLTRHGYYHEAEAAEAMYGPQGDAARRCRELLDRSLRAHRQNPPREYELIDDRREPRDVRASVIVSLFNAADKLPRFLDALGLQTLLNARQAELVLVDSGSPGDEYRVFRHWAESHSAPVVYARSARRESIQAAWNRGISLARGRYFCFLGVDEAIRPSALEILAAELDAHPHIDWVQAKCLVTEVDDQGHWLNDVMTYDRSGYAQRLVSLESCYLSYVGAMYRREVHQRVGYYDSSFGGAGDTEFKNRALPFIRSKEVPQTLGIFWNYPDGQTTRSPRAEIEDLRAWYLHRSAAGVAYALQNADLHEAESLLVAALAYRKSYCRHTSSDVEYASLVAQHIVAQWKEPQTTGLHAGIDRLLQAYRDLDCLPQISAPVLARALDDVRLVERQVSEQHRLAMAHFEPAYDVFADNRHEQHSGVWPTEHTAAKELRPPIVRRAA